MAIWNNAKNNLNSTKSKDMNSKILFLIFTIMLILSKIGFSQNTLVTEWEIIESSPLENGNAEAWAIGSDQNGNLYWGVNNDMPGLFEFMNAWVYRMDEDGNNIWKVEASTGTFAQQSYNLKVVDGVVYVGGRTCKAIGIDSCDVLFFTTDAIDGDSDWEFVWDGGFGYEEIDGISIESDGIILTGWSVGDGTEVDLLLMKIDFDGNIIWQNTWGSMTANDDHQDGHIVVDDSFIYISGLYNGSPLLGWEGLALLAKFDKTDGSLVDSLTYGRQDQWVNAENALGMTTDGTYLYTTGYTTTSVNNWDIFVAKFDKDFNEIWYTTWGGEEAGESARSIAVHEDGSIYVGANTESYGNGEMDMALLKFDPSGTLEWYKTWGDIADDQILDVHLRNNALYLTGKSNSFHESNKWEATLLKVNLDIYNSTEDVGSSYGPTAYFYPNPTNNIAVLKWKNTSIEAKSLVIYDLLGQKVKTINNISSREIEIKKDELGSGVFLYKVMFMNQETFTGKFVIN